MCPSTYGTAGDNDTANRLCLASTRGLTAPRARPYRPYLGRCDLASLPLIYRAHYTILHALT